ncbi:hypothetical protein HN51_071476 [Arachis hypogaea]
MVTLVLPTLVESYGLGEVLECVNGIICHYERGREVIGLWNPKTDEHKIIPPGISDDEPGFDRHVSVHGFGYDNVNDDYKVIQCVYYIYGRTLFEEPVLRIWQIYSLKSNCWKKLDLEMTQKEDVDKASIAYLNGVCHWWGSEFATNELEEQVLVSFNLSTETFRTTSIVWVQENDDSPTRTLVVLNESVILISSFAQNNRIEISILGEVGVKESWVKLFTLGPFPSEFRYPMRMGNKCDVIFYIGDDSNELASIDVITDKNQFPDTVATEKVLRQKLNRRRKRDVYVEGKALKARMDVKKEEVPHLQHEHDLAKVNREKIKAEWSEFGEKFIKIVVEPAVQD